MGDEANKPKIFLFESETSPKYKIRLDYLPPYDKAQPLFKAAGLKLKNGPVRGDGVFYELEAANSDTELKTAYDSLVKTDKANPVFSYSGPLAEGKVIAIGQNIRNQEQNGLFYNTKRVAAKKIWSTIIKTKPGPELPPKPEYVQAIWDNAAALDAVLLKHQESELATIQKDEAYVTARRDLEQVVKDIESKVTKNPDDASNQSSDPAASAKSQITKQEWEKIKQAIIQKVEPEAKVAEFKECEHDGKAKDKPNSLTISKSGTDPKSLIEVKYDTTKQELSINFQQQANESQRAIVVQAAMTALGPERCQAIVMTVGDCKKEDTALNLVAYLIQNGVGAVAFDAQTKDVLTDEYKPELLQAAVTMLAKKASDNKPNITDAASLKNWVANNKVELDKSLSESKENESKSENKSNLKP